MDYKKLIDIHIELIRLEAEASGEDYYAGGIAALEDLLAEIEEAEE